MADGVLTVLDDTSVSDMDFSASSGLIDRGASCNGEGAGADGDAEARGGKEKSYRESERKRGVKTQKSYKWAATDNVPSES